VPREAWLLRPSEPVAYGAANELMHRLAERRLAGEIPDTVMLVEHPPVFTAGRRATPDELVWSAEEIERRGAEIHRIDRGGSFTFHGPGQLVGYPILDLGVRPDAAAHLRRLEEIVLRAAATLGLRLERRPDVQTGVWAGDRKVCAIGVRLMRARVTLHGFAVNCDTDLSWFTGIVPCGLPDRGVTSLSELAGRRVPVRELVPPVELAVGSVLDLRLRSTPPDLLEDLRSRAMDAAAPSRRVLADGSEPRTAPTGVAQAGASAASAYLGSDSSHPSGHGSRAR
jgi:lipoyl(octanoyl) transferase